MDRPPAAGTPTEAGWYNLTPVVHGAMRGAMTVRVYASQTGDLVFHELPGEPERKVADPALVGWKWQGPYARESEAMNALAPQRGAPGSARPSGGAAPSPGKSPGKPGPRPGAKS